MEFIDTHSHLYDEAFNGEYDSAVSRAVEAGVTGLVFPDIDSQSRDAMFSMAQARRNHIPLPWSSPDLYRCRLGEGNGGAGKMA